VNRSVKAGLAATLSLAVLAGCDAAALRNLAQTAATTPSAGEQQPAANDFKALAGTWYLIDQENTQDFNPEKGTLQFTKDGSVFRGIGTFTLFGGGQKSLTKLVLTKDKPRTGSQANISIDFTVNDTTIIGKIFDENSGSTDKSVGELTGKFAVAADGNTKLELAFTTTKQFGDQPGNTVPGGSTGGGGVIVNPIGGGSTGGGSTGGGDITVTPGDGGTTPTVLPRVEELSGAWIFELGDAPLFAGRKTGILLQPGVNGGIDAKVLQDQNGNPAKIGVVTGLTVDRDSNGMANLVGVLELDGGQKLKVRYVATFIKDTLNPNGRWILRSGLLEGTPFTVSIPPSDGGSTGPTDPIYPNPEWLTALTMAGDQRLAIYSGVTNPDLGDLGLRVTRTNNGALRVELFQATLAGPNTLAEGGLMPAGPDGRFVAKAFVTNLGGEIRIELMAPPAGGDKVGVMIFNAANELLLEAALEAFGGGNQGGGGEPGLPPLEAFGGDWVFVFPNNSSPFGNMMTGVQIIPLMGGGVSARVLQETDADSVPAVIGKVERLFVERLATGKFFLKGELVLDDGMTYPLRYLAAYKPDPSMPGGGRLVLISGLLGNREFVVEEIPAEDDNGNGGSGPVPGPLPAPLAFAGQWKLDFGTSMPDFGGEMVGLSLKPDANGMVRGDLMAKGQNDPTPRAVGRVLEFRLFQDANTQMPRAAVNVDLGNNRIAGFVFDVAYITDTASQVGRWVLQSGNLTVDNQQYRVYAAPFEGGNGGGGNFPLAIDEVFGQWSVFMNDGAFNPIGSGKFDLAIFNDGGYRASVTAYDSQGNASTAGQIVNLRLEGYPGGTELVGDYYGNSNTPFKVRFPLMDNRNNQNQRPWLLTNIEISDGANQGHGNVAPANQQQQPVPEPFVALPDSFLGEYALNLMGLSPYRADYGLFLGTVTTGNQDRPLLFTASLFGQASGSVAHADDLKITKRDDGSFVAEGLLTISQGVIGPETLKLTLNFLADGSVRGAFGEANTNTTTFAAVRPANGGGGGGIEPPAAGLPKELQGRYTMQWFNGNPYGRDL